MSIIIPQDVVKKLEEGKDYEFVPNDAHALTIKILRDPFQGVVVFFGKVGLYEKPTDEIDPSTLKEDTILGDKYELVKDQDMTGVLEFKYEILRNEEWVLTKHWGHFELMLGKILETILQDAIANPSKYDVFVYSEEGAVSGLKPIGIGELDSITPPKVSLWQRILNWFKP
jgi:hypothetical protein